MLMHCASQFISQTILTPRQHEGDTAICLWSRRYITESSTQHTGLIIAKTWASIYLPTRFQGTQPESCPSCSSFRGLDKRARDTGLFDRGAGYTE